MWLEIAVGEGPCVRHFGHVDGLGLFGKETLNAKGLALYLSSSMKTLVNEIKAKRNTKFIAYATVFVEGFHDN